MHRTLLANNPGLAFCVIPAGAKAGVFHDRPRGLKPRPFTASMSHLVLIFGLIAFPVAEGQTIRSGEDVLRAMHDRYKDSWYQTITFTQKSTTYKSDGTSSAETWYEAASLPGNLRIDIGPASDGKGYIFADGNVTVVKDNKVVDTRKSVNMLLVLGFDVYTQDPAKTIAVAKGEGFDLSKLHEDTWEGHPAYVVGADRGD